MLSLYQMIDADFMAHLKEVGGQLFVREVNDDLIMVVGIMTRPKELSPEHLYAVRATFDITTGKEIPESKGCSLDGMLRQSIWGVVDDV